MNIFIWALIVIFIMCIISVWIFLGLNFKKKYRISDYKRKYFYSQLESISSYNSYKWQIIDLDKLYHKILLEAWYFWSFWEILKQEPSEIENINKIWELHKIRNSIVHDFTPTFENVLKEKSIDYENEIKKLLNKF